VVLEARLDVGVGNQSSLSPGDLINRAIYISTGLRAGFRVSVPVIPLREIPLE
jgi:hypothetical protein